MGEKSYFRKSESVFSYEKTIKKNWIKDCKVHCSISSIICALLGHLRLIISLKFHKKNVSKDKWCVKLKGQFKAETNSNNTNDQEFFRHSKYAFALLDGFFVLQSFTFVSQYYADELNALFFPGTTWYLNRNLLLMEMNGTHVVNDLFDIFKPLF